MPVDTLLLLCSMLLSCAKATLYSCHNNIGRTVHRTVYGARELAEVSAHIRAHTHHDVRSCVQNANNRKNCILSLCRRFLYTPPQATLCLWLARCVYSGSHTQPFSHIARTNTTAYERWACSLFLADTFSCPFVHVCVCVCGMSLKCVQSFRFRTHRLK